MTVFSYYKEARSVQEQWVVTDYEAYAGKEVNEAFAVSPAAGKLQKCKTHLSSVHAAMETAIMTLNPENGNVFFVCRATLLAAESLLRNKKLFRVWYPMSTVFR